MISKTAHTERTCPLCNKVYIGIPATSRKPPHEAICPDCGTREALSFIGINRDEQEEILAVVHKYTTQFTP